MRGDPEERVGYEHGVIDDWTCAYKTELWMGWTGTTDFYSALGDSPTSVTFAWFMDLGLEEEAPFLGNLRPCNVLRLPGWADLIVERRLNLHHIFWNMSVKTVLVHPLWVPCISGLLGKLHYKRGTEKSIKTFFFFLQLKPKLVLRSRGVWNIDKTFGNPDVCQNIWVMLD